MWSLNSLSSFILLDYSKLDKLCDSPNKDHSKRLIFGKRQTTIGCAVLYFVRKNERLKSIKNLSGYLYNELINYGRS